MAIYGRETTRYKLTISNHSSNPLNVIKSNATDWEFKDTLLDNTNNDMLEVDINHTTTVDVIYESSGLKDVIAITDFDDGWGNTYQHLSTIQVTVLTYEEPVLNISWLPQEPTITDEVTFHQEHTDARNMSLNQQYGRIDEVRVDIFNDGTYEHDHIDDITDVKYQFTTKADGIGIRYHITYWDGFQYQTTELVKNLNMANTPPVSDWSRVDDGVCIPTYDWTATSTDIDDAVTDLTYTWKLYQLVNVNNWNLVDTGQGITYQYPFQYENRYKLVLTTTDKEGLTNDKSEEFDIAFGKCSDNGNTTGCSLGGDIQLQPGFQLITIPTTHGRFDTTTGTIVKDTTKAKVKNYLLDQLSHKLNIPYSDIGQYIESCVAVRGGELSQNFVPVITPDTSVNNFELAYTDNEAIEFTAFYVNVKSTNTLPKISWEYYDGK